jgi:hydroxymethylpyrimidine pyrophosphatase-like HAD family hydrolase
MALKRFKKRGRRLVLVTGRQLPDLKAVVAEHALFDRIAVENGAPVYDPATRQKRILAEAPSAAFVAALTRQKVEPLSVGTVIIAIWAQPWRILAFRRSMP